MSRNATTLHIVEPFEYSFVLINRRTGHCSYFSSLDNVLLAADSTGFDRQPDYLPHRFSVHPRLSPYEKERMVFTGPLWHVCNHLGRPIEQHELEARIPHLPVRAYSWRRTTSLCYEIQPEGESKRLTRIKGSPTKIKAVHQHVRKNRWRGSYYATVCPLYRHVRTQNERRQTHNHILEWGEYDRMMRSARKKLPTYYDDTVVSARKGQKSWKHHSKRRKQWMGKL